MLTPEEKELVLRIASLMEAGSFGMQQITGHYITEDRKGCCALGAILIVLRPEHYTADLLTLLEIDSWPRIPIPAINNPPYAYDDDLGTAPLPDVVIVLNDREGWSFSRIIDYLRDCTLDKPATIAVQG